MSLIGIVVFPGSNCEQDVAHALGLLGAETKYVWHLETDLNGLDGIVLPGGFAYGDYLRTGAIAAHSPAMSRVRELADKGTPVIGICNGFQILCEAGLLPGALRRNQGLKFICRTVHVKVETNSTIFTNNTSLGQVLEIPINHFDGGYYCPQDTLTRLNGNGRVVLRYCDRQGRETPASNPNGALDNIAGIISENGNVMGLMPHPERATDPALGGTDGRFILSSMLESAVAAGVLTA